MPLDPVQLRRDAAPPTQLLPVAFLQQSLDTKGSDSVRHSARMRRDLRHRRFGACHLHAARNEQTEGEGQEQPLVGGTLEKAANGAIQIH